MKFEKLLPRLTRRIFSFNPILSDKANLWGKNTGRTTDLFLSTWMGRTGIIVLAFFIFVAIYAVLFMPYDKWETNENTMAPPTLTHPFGTDQAGKDVLTRTAHGARASLTVGFAAMGISMGVGTLVGLVSGYWGGWRDEVIMRVNDVFLSIPWLVLMIVIAAIWGNPTLASVIIVIGITGWSTTARIVRSQVLSLKVRQFVERSKAIGAGDWHIIRRHVFPNVVPLVFANAILMIAISILSESTLSFIGLGPQDVETWGKGLEDAYNNGAAVSQLSFIVMPGLCIVGVVLAFTFIGYAMDEVMNPKLRKR